MTNISTATRAELRETLRAMRAENLDVSKQLDLIHSDIIGMDPVTLEHNGGNTDPDQVTTIRAGRLMVRCLAKNAARTAAKLRSACRTPSTRQHVGARVFPKFEQGMSTAEYVAAFETLNQNAYGEVNALPYNLTNYLAPCTLYEGDALDFEPIEQPIDAPELTTEDLQPVAIVSELTGATMATVPRHVADQVPELIASATTAAVIEQASEAAPIATPDECEADPVPELATVDASSASGPRLNEQQAIEWAAALRDESIRIQKAEAKAKPEVSKTGKLPVFPVDSYRLERFYANGAKIKPLPARTFSLQEVQSITDWFKSIGWSVTSGSGGNGINATNDIGMTIDDLPAPYTAAQRKKDEALLASDERAAAKKKEQEGYLASTAAGKFVAGMFGDAMNSFNQTALAKVLSGDEKVFVGLFSNRSVDVLAEAGIATEGREIKDVIRDIKARFEAAPTDAAKEPDQAPELATVDACSESEASATTCDASSASSTPSAPQHGRASSRPHQAPPKPTHDAHGQRIGQRVAGNSGHWCAVMFTDPDGRPSFEFEGPDGSIEVWNFTTGRDRMAALQAMARQADQAAQDTDDQDDQQTEREHRLNAFDAMTATAADVQAMGAEYVAQLLDDLEDINYHTEGLILQALAAGREDLAARARANLREHLAAGYLTDALRLDRQAISEALRQSTEPDPTHPAGDTPSSDPTSAPGYTPPAPDAHQQTAPVPNLADKVPRAVGADSGPASNPPGATAPSAPAPSAPAPSAPAPAAEASADELEPEFTRTRPQPFDMLAMIAAGLAPDDFVGLGIVYSGDRANPSGRGAITDVRPCSWYKYTITVTLEDGRQSRLNPVSFTEHLGNRYKTDFKRHGAPYLAELAAARLAVEAADKAAKQAAADDKARQRRELPKQWPQLKAYDPAGKLNGPTLAAHNIRVLLKEQFPKIKFSVKSDRYSGGDSIDIRWTDGPNTKAVEKIADQFEAGSFNGQEDIYEYAHSVFRDLFGDAKYIHCNRDISDALLAQAIEADYPSAEGRPTVEDYRKARGAFSYEHRNEWAARRIRERLETMGAGLPS